MMHQTDVFFYSIKAQRSSKVIFITLLSVCLLHVSFPDCSGKKPLEGPLKEELESALALAEQFTQQYNSLLKRLEERMFNTSSLLDVFNRQFGWVSSLANNTESKDDIFRVQTVCHSL